MVPSNHGSSRDEDKAGPQGTRMFSPDEVDDLVARAKAGEDEPAGPSALIGQNSPVTGRRFALDTPRIVIGRSLECDITVDEPGVSSQHAKISKDGQGWRVANLLSTNGTFVNGQKVSSVVLSDGDRIRVGRVELVFSDSGIDHSPSLWRSSRLWWSLAALVGAALIVLAGIRLL